MIEYFGPGDHHAGFIGFQVMDTVDGHLLKKMFSTRKAARQASDDPLVQWRYLCAMEQHLAWHIAAEEVRYRKLVSEEHHLTLPHRGVGVRCLTASFVPAGNSDDAWAPCFLVARHRDELGRRQGPKRFHFKTALFSEAWREAVHFWADEHTVFDEDRDRVLATPPSPGQFSALRKQMNAEGRDIPTEALEPVFREQRLRLAKARASSEDTAAIEERLAEELSNWKRRPRVLDGRSR